MSLAILSAPPVRALVRKELREYRQHRMILASAVALPLVFLFLPMVNLIYLPASTSPEDIDFAVGQAMFCFFLTPVIIPATMAAFAVIGERDQGTLEPMLTLPMSDSQFLAGKITAIVTPATLISIAVYAGYVVLSALLVHGTVRDRALDPTWAIGVPGLALPLALYSTLIGMAVSARAKDLRVAEQLAGLVLFPTLAPIFLIAGRVIPLNPGTWAIAIASVLLLDLFLLLIVRRQFVRERAILAAG